MSNLKQKTLDQSRAPGYGVGFNSNDVGATDVKTLVIRWMKVILDNINVSAEQLPILDSFQTATDLAIVVKEIDDNTIEDNCMAVFNNVVLDIIIYQRQDCPVAGALSLIDKYIHARLQELIGNYNLISISGARRVDAKPTRFIERDFQARTITIVIDYAYNKT